MIGLIDRLVAVVICAGVGAFFYAYFDIRLRNKAYVEQLRLHHPLLHPNAICQWRVALGWIGLIIYFWLNQFELGVLFFTVSAFFDAIDGLIARKANLVTEWGKSLDPLCDKLTYLPALFGFWYRGDIDGWLVLIFAAVEIIGQFGSRPLLKKLKMDTAANQLGKLKAAAVFSLIIYLAVMSEYLRHHNFADQWLFWCTVFAVASIGYKFIPNHQYANIISSSNLVCGVASIVFFWYGKTIHGTLAIIIGQVLDLLDGRAALKWGSTPLGVILDDIADFVSFGLATGYLIFAQSGRNPWFILVGAAYVASVSFRLYRYTKVDSFDTTLPANTFNGLPSPAGATLVIGVSLTWQQWPAVLAGTVISSMLMVSHVRFSHFGRGILKGKGQILLLSFGLVFIAIASQALKYQEDQLLGATLLFFLAPYLVIGHIQARHASKQII